MRVWVNGCFDVLHIGHIKMLRYAASFGTLRVGLDTDERVKESKGSSRPFNALEDRMEFLESIKYVDSTVSFSSDEELEARIKEWCPDILVIGTDYLGKRIVGSQYAQEIIYFERIENKSTSKILSYENISSRRNL